MFNDCSTGSSKQHNEQKEVTFIKAKCKWHFHDGLFNPQAAKKAKESFEAAGDKSGVALLG